MTLTSASVNITHTCCFPFAKQPQAGSCPTTFGSVVLASLACCTPCQPHLGLAVQCKASQGVGGKAVTVTLATPGWEAGTSLSPPQAQLVALCDYREAALLVTKVLSAQGAPWARAGTAGGGCCPVTCSCGAAVLLTGCVAAQL